MRATQCGIAEYARIFRIAREQLLRERLTKQVDDYRLSVHASWETSYCQLPLRVAQLLHLMSFFHHEGISEDFFEVSSTRSMSYEVEIPLTESQDSTKAVVFDFLSSLRTSSSEWDPLAFKILTNQLRAFSLLDYDTHSCSYSMHPLVQEWSRTSAPGRSIVRESSTWILALSVKDEDSSEDYSFRRRLLPHLVALDSDHKQMVPELATSLYLVYEEAGYAKEAEGLLAIALQASRDALGNERTTTLKCMHNLSGAYLDQGKLEEASALLTEVVEIKKRVLSHEHQSTFTSMHNLACTYSFQQRWEEAEAVFLEVVEARKRLFGAEHRETLASMGMLATAHWSQGRLDEAEALYVEVLEITRRALGREHPNTLASMHNLAVTYLEQGKLREAELLMEETVVLDKKVRGELHVETQKSIRFLDKIQRRIRLELRVDSAP